jgi:hypothetical protein
LATLVVQPVARVGVAPTYAACTGGGDAAPVGDRNWIQVKNGSGAPITVTVATNPSGGAPFAGTALATESFSVPATTGDIVYGPLTPQLFADPTTGMATITYSGVTSLTIGVFTLT